MPIIFRKVYATVKGKRQVVSTTKITSTAARRLTELRKKQKAQRESERTLENFLKKIVTPIIKAKADPLFKSKMEEIGAVVQKNSKKTEYVYKPKYFDNTSLQGTTITIGEPVYFKKVEFDDRPYDLGMPNLELRRKLVNRMKLNAEKDKQEALGSQSDLRRMGLMSEGVDIETKEDRQLNGLLGLLKFGFGNGS